jgi:hypothetical protein
MNIFLDHIATWAAVTVVTLLTVFSDKILGGIRLRLNRADLRVKYFEQLAVDLSTYIYWAEIYHLYFQSGWTQEPERLVGIAGELNGAETTLRIKEYVYRSWVRKYWGDDGAVRFSQVMDAVKDTTKAALAFNDEARWQDPEKTAALGSELDRLRDLTERWLSETDA